MIYLLRKCDIISVLHMLKAYITARSAISYRRYTSIVQGTDIIEKSVPKERFFLERVMGVEPTRPAWKAGILPLNYTRKQTVFYHQNRSLSTIILAV